MPNGSLTVYGQLNSALEVAKTSIYAVQTILADSFCVSLLISFPSYFADHAGLKGLAMLYCLAEILACNCLSHHYGPRDGW